MYIVGLTVFTCTLVNSVLTDTSKRWTPWKNKNLELVMYSLYLTLYETDIFLRWTYLHVVRVPMMSDFQKKHNSRNKFSQNHLSIYIWISLFLLGKFKICN